MIREATFSEAFEASTRDPECRIRPVGSTVWVRIRNGELVGAEWRRAFTVAEFAGRWEIEEVGGFTVRAGPGRELWLLFGEHRIPLTHVVMSLDAGQCASPYYRTEIHLECFADRVAVPDDMELMPGMIFTVSGIDPRIDAIEMAIIGYQWETAGSRNLLTKAQLVGRYPEPTKEET